MKVIDQVLVDSVIAEVKKGTHGYEAHFKREVLKLAIRTNANHAAWHFGIAYTTVNTWLRQAGFESAINSYYYKSA